MALILWQYTFALLFCTELCVTMHMVDLSLSLRPKSKNFFVTGGVWIAQWLELRTRDRNVAGSNP